jgi:hypothetical protein
MILYVQKVQGEGEEDEQGDLELEEVTGKEWKNAHFLVKIIFYVKEQF